MADAIPQQDGVFGTEQLETTNGPLNELLFVIGSVLAKVNVATLVQVKAVHSGGRTAAVGTVDVMPLVNQVTGNGQAIQHTTVYGLPFFRLQGGASAVICDPVVNDIGIALFCDRDISAAKASVAAATPGSARRFSYSDGVYFGGWGAKVAPSKFIVLDDTGCEISCDTKVDGNQNVTGVYKVAGTQVVGPQQSNIPAPTGGGTIDAQSRTAITAILSLLHTHGLMA